MTDKNRRRSHKTYGRDFPSREFFMSGFRSKSKRRTFSRIIDIIIYNILPLCDIIINVIVVLTVCWVRSKYNSYVDV